ncbi:MAG: hypothetical protein ACD_4C00300G0002 [uncultured bacterium (gcode 4)]|uniref:Uncharacterized protein n=1 Tax=uncultured bacterium (gcode 4) TaxID=1234023 RepID=K2F5Q2_9BACT|nr:MAG: hypothetical protein ACD_4C00300G0002 [uncultured bacterium (gcode 4)]
MKSKRNKIILLILLSFSVISTFLIEKFQKFFKEENLSVNKEKLVSNPVNKCEIKDITSEENDVLFVGCNDLY